MELATSCYYLHIWYYEIRKHLYNRSLPSLSPSLIIRHMWQPQQQRGPHCNVFWTNSRVNTFFCLRMRNNLMITLRVIYWLINSYWTFLSKMHWKYYLWYKLVIYSVKLVWYVYDVQVVKYLVFLKCSDFFSQFFSLAYTHWHRGKWEVEGFGFRFRRSSSSTLMDSTAPRSADPAGAAGLLPRLYFTFGLPVSPRRSRY